MANSPELVILSAQRRRLAKRPILYVEARPDPECCPYCQRHFTLVVGCQKVCSCGYSEGCED